MTNKSGSDQILTGFPECLLLFVRLIQIISVVVGSITYGCAVSPGDPLVKFPQDATKINLSYSLLDSLPENIGNYYQLKTLKLYKNKFRYLPESIGNLQQLEKLIASGNNLEQLPVSLGQLTSLKELSLQYNNLNALPPEIGLLKNLEILRLNNNRLHELPPEIGNLENLKYLYLGNNRLKRLPPEIGKLKNLRILDVGQNLLSDLPPSLAEMESLTELHLVRSGPGLEVPVSLCALRSLEYVAISSNIFVPNCWLSRKTGRFQLEVK